MPVHETGCTVATGGVVTFAHRDARAASVLVAGSFTGWSARAVPMAREPGSDRWVAQTGPLPAGTYAYKYVVDGRWVADPAQGLDVDDGVGGRNSAFVVGLRDLGDRRAVRVLSLNLHTYQERNGEGQNDSLAKLERVAFAAAVAEVDVLLLQEVGEHVSDPAHPNAGEVLRGHLERLTRKRWSHEWREAHIGFDVYREGLSILSSGPLGDVAAFPLGGGGMARIALMGVVEVKGVRLRVATTHVGWGAEGGEQARRLALELGQRSGGDHAATLVAGDFNAGAAAPQITAMVKSGYVEVGAARGATFQTFGDGDGARPRGLHDRIDYHFLRTSAGRSPPRVAAFRRVLDGEGPADGLHPRVSDHAGIFAAYLWDTA